MKGTCKDCPCAVINDDELDLYPLVCHLDPQPYGKNETDWCYRGREIMEYEAKVAAFLAQEDTSDE